MAPLPPNAAPPPRPKGNVKRPLLVNIGLMLLLYPLAAAFTDGHHAADTAYAYFFALVGLFILNVLAAVVAAIAGRSQTALGFVYSGLLIFLVGLGACAYTVTHLAG